MGNITSITSTQTNYGRYLEATHYIANPSLLQAVKAIDPEDLHRELNALDRETPSIIYRWVEVMQKERIINWTNISSVVTKCVYSMSKKKVPMAYVGALLDYIINTPIHTRLELSTKLLTIIELAQGVDDYLDYVDYCKLRDTEHPYTFLQFHEAAVRAIATIVRLCSPNEISRLVEIIFRINLGRDLCSGGYGLYKDVGLFRQAGFGEPEYR
jgi:hypothetical protein